MGIAIFFVLAVIAAAAIVYPLLPGRSTSPLAPTLTDGEIERAVRNLRQRRSRNGLSCPTCGHAFQPGDRFCVHCGGTLPQPQADPVGAGSTQPNAACPSCGATIRQGDEFCAKCGHNIAAGEVA